MSNSNIELVNNIKLIADEKKIPRDTVSDALKDAFIKAFAKEFPETEIEVNIDIDNAHLSINRLFKVVDAYEDLNDYNEIALQDTNKKDGNLKVGDIYKEPVEFTQLNRGITSHILQVFKHNISCLSNHEVYKEWQPRIGEVIFAEVEKVDNKTQFITVILDNTFGFVSRQERIPGEIIVPGQKYNFFIKDVKEQTKGWPIILSRADSGLVRYLLRLQIPEIQESIIEIKQIARVAGFKTKLSVISHQSGVEAVGTIIGPRGSRIKLIQEQIHGEHIEVIEYTDDFSRYIVNVCSPAEISGVAVTEPKTPEERKQVTLIARKDKLALLIGKRGSNVRLISELLNANVEIMDIEEAHEANLQYTRIDMQSLRQQSFNRAFNKYRSGADVLNNYSRGARPTYGQAKPSPQTTDHNEPNKARKQKSSILDSFKNMNKDDLLSELSSVDTSSDLGDDINNDFDEDNK